MGPREQRHGLDRAAGREARNRRRIGLRAPARATDLTGLPPAFIDCGSAEVFRDEDVAYATALWHAGVQAELHIWPGGFHGFGLTAPHTALAHAMTAARNAWVARLLGS